MRTGYCKQGAEGTGNKKYKKNALWRLSKLDWENYVLKNEDEYVFFCFVFM